MDLKQHIIKIAGVFLKPLNFLFLSVNLFQSHLAKSNRMIMTRILEWQRHNNSTKQ